MDPLSRLRELTENLPAHKEQEQKDLEQLQRVVAECIKHGCSVITDMLQAGDISPECLARCQERVNVRRANGAEEPYRESH